MLPTDRPPSWPPRERAEPHADATDEDAARARRAARQAARQTARDQAARDQAAREGEGGGNAAGVGEAVSETEGLETRGLKTGTPETGAVARADADFGFTRVPLDAKQGLVDDVFRSVARRYDLMNDLMSGGLHRAWKDALVVELNPPKDRAFRLLDVAGGTGDVAFRVLRAAGPRARAIVLDVNADMLAVGRERALAMAARRGVRARPDAARARFVAGNAESLPLPDGSVDAVTIAFGIRNVPRIDVALREAHRVLRRGGRFLCLEFSKVDVPVLDRIYERYSFDVIPRLGGAVTGDANSYRYLVESIRRFPGPLAFEDRVSAAGFRRVSHRVFSGGIVALHSGWKL